MKKTFIAFLLIAYVFASSCSRNNPNPGGSWTFKGTTYNVVSCVTTQDGIGATNGPSTSSTYSTVGATFFNSLPTTGGTYTVVNGNPVSANQVLITTTTNGVSGNIYGSTGGNGSNQTVTVSVSNGKVSVSGSGIEMYDINNVADSSALQLNITQLQ